MARHLLGELSGPLARPLAAAELGRHALRHLTGGLLDGFRGVGAQHPLVLGAGLDGLLGGRGEGTVDAAGTNRTVDSVVAKADAPCGDGERLVGVEKVLVDALEEALEVTAPRRDGVQTRGWHTSGWRRRRSDEARNSAAKPGSHIKPGGGPRFGAMSPACLE